MHPHPTHATVDQEAQSARSQQTTRDYDYPRTSPAERELSPPAAASPSPTENAPAPPARRAPIAILGVPLDQVTTAEAIERIEQMIASARPHYLVTANVDFLVQAQGDIELHRILFDAHLVLCDGTPLVWASRLLGNSLPERVAGADLVPLLIEVAAQKGYRLFFLGASPESAQRAVTRLTARYPKLIIADHYSPPFSKLLEMDHDQIKRRILNAKPDLLFVCFGCPKQEKWIAMHYQTLGVPVAIGLGATIDFLAGEVKRAPRWMQRSGTEWIFRLSQEPRRLFRRYVKDLWVFGWKIAAQSWELRLRSLRSGSGDLIQILSQDGCHQATLPERLDLAFVRLQPLFAEQILNDGRHCLLIVDKVKFIDSTGIGFLIRLQKKLHEHGRHLVIVAPSVPLQRALSLMHLQTFLTTSPDLVSARQLIDQRASEACPSISEHNLQAPLSWHGEITAANVDQVWQRTCRHFTQFTSPSQWAIDLRQVRFMDSSGLGMMVRLKKLAQKHGSTIVFKEIPMPVRNVLQLARLEEFLLAKP